MNATTMNCPACHGGPTGEHGHAALRAIGFAATYTCVSCLSPWRRTRGFDEHYTWEKLGFDPTLFDDPPARAAAPVRKPVPLVEAWRRFVGRSAGHVIAGL